MKVSLYGTRGSISISSPDAVEFGGNTTCLRVQSRCLPAGRALVIDTGTGFVPCSKDLLGEGIRDITVLYTHYHHDHTGGLLLAPHTFIEGCKLNVMGPKEHSAGPEDVIADIMRPPHFPVHFARVKHRFRCHSLDHVGTQVLVVHPEAGFHLVEGHAFEAAAAEGRPLPLHGRGCSIDECLVIRMLRTTHPEYTVSFRLEERPTGKVFVFLTDHENTDGISKDLLQHVLSADLLIQDGQYSRATYDSRTAGFGHGTPDYCARLAHMAKVQRLGLTHHDPGAKDKDVRARCDEARAFLLDLGSPGLAETVFACRDYQVLEV